VCPTLYQTRHFFSNFNTNEDIATKFEEYVRCVRNEEECVCSRCNMLISGKIIKEMPGSVASGTPYTFKSITVVQDEINLGISTVARTCI